MIGLKTAEIVNKTAKMKTSEILQKLHKAQKTSNGWNALCPSHDDKQRSLSIKESDGKILLKCFAGCDTQNIVSALGLDMKDLFESSNGYQSNGNSQRKRIAETYDYTDETGKLLFQSLRYEPKDFRQRQPDENGGFIWNLENIRLVLYRLPEVLVSPLVYLVEGEKDVETLRENDLVASCNPMGAGKWQNDYNESLRDKTIVILPDNDEPGRKHALQVANSLHGIAKEIVIIKLPNLPPKGDVTDYFQNGGTVDELIGLLECAETWQPGDESEIDTEINEIDETPIEVKPFPQPHEKCFFGLAGDYVRFIEPHTEADKMALLIQFLTYFGNVIGRSVFYQVEGNRHFTNLFCVLVGDTASGRKGTSLSRIKEIFQGLDEAHEKNCIVSGLASGEGLLYHVRDALYVQKKNRDTGELEEILSDSGVSDKRLLVVEGEFAQVLRVQGREGNSLSAIIRNFWDSGKAQNLTKNSPLKTTDAHVSIVGHITGTELLNCLSEVESANGYANRFLWICVRRSKLLPFDSKIDSLDLRSINADISRRIQFARNIKQIYLSDEAKELWASSYEHLETSRFGFVAKITQRASPYVLRLSCIFALLDAQTEIKSEHLEAGLAVWQYCEDSAKYIFGERLGNKNADMLLDALREAENGLTRTEIYTDVFQKNLSAKEIKKALQILLEVNLIESKTEQTQNAKKPSEKWFAKHSGLRI